MTNDPFYVNDELTPQDDLDDFVSEVPIPERPDIPVADGYPEPVTISSVDQTAIRYSDGTLDYVDFEELNHVEA